MTGFVWLASYPRSGNTWFRLLCAGLDIDDDQPVDINDLNHGDDGALAFDAITLLDSALLSSEEADCLRPGVHRAIATGDYRDPGRPRALEPPAPRLVKIHDRYRLTRAGAPVFAEARGAIVIVRDPRAVAASLASFLSCGVDRAIDHMASDDFALGNGLHGRALQARQIVGSWSGNVRSWVEQGDVPIHLVRYEDLQADAAGVICAAMRFAGRHIAHGEAEKAARRVDFDALRQQELRHGFREWSTSERPADATFFRRGKAYAWRDELTDAQIARIGARHGATIEALGYPDA